MTIWITGASGFIGRHLARHLAAAGHAVAGIGHGEAPPGVGQWVPGPVDAAGLARLAAMTGPPAAVHHLAGGSSVGASIADPDEDRRRTIGSTEALLGWLRAHAPGRPLVAVSSAAVYGAGHTGPIADTAPPDPASPYARHKLAMEALCRAAAGQGQPVAIARLFSVYGEGLRKQLPWDLCRRLAAGERAITLGGSGEEMRDWAHVGDVARHLAALPARATSGAPACNLATGRALHVREAAALLAAPFGPVSIGFDGRRRPGDPFALVADAGDAARLDFRVAVEQGLPAYARWVAGGAE